MINRSSMLKLSLGFIVLYVILTVCSFYLDSFFPDHYQIGLSASTLIISIIIAFKQWPVGRISPVKCGIFSAIFALVCVGALIVKSHFFNGPPGLSFYELAISYAFNIAVSFVVIKLTNVAHDKNKTDNSTL